MSHKVLELQLDGPDLSPEDWFLMNKTGLFMIRMRQKPPLELLEINEGMGLCESCMALLSLLGVPPEAFMDYWQALSRADIVAFQSFLAGGLLEAVGVSSHPQGSGDFSG